MLELKEFAVQNQLSLSPRSILIGWLMVRTFHQEYSRNQKIQIYLSLQGLLWSQCSGYTKYT